MGRKQAKKASPRTWDGLEEPDVTGADEAEAEQLIEFGRRSKKPARSARRSRSTSRNSNPGR